MHHLFSVFTALACLAPALTAAEPPATTPSVIRKPLLTAALVPPKSVARVESQEITLAPHVHGGLHLHPCPVVGLVTSGTIRFQLEGDESRQLRAGDAFYEPANVRVARFDNDSAAPAIFTAFYLLGEGDRELIRMLTK